MRLPPVPVTLLNIAKKGPTMEFAIPENIQCVHPDDRERTCRIDHE